VRVHEEIIDINLSRFLLDPDSVPLNYSEVLAIYPVLMTAVSTFCANFMFQFYSPIVAPYFEDTYGASPTTIGYYMCVLPGTYTITSLIVSTITTNKTHVFYPIQIKYILAGIMMMGLAGFFTGPTKALTGLDHNLYITLLSYAVLGIGAAPV
jgi:hypothetical protein